MGFQTALERRTGRRRGLRNCLGHRVRGKYSNVAEDSDLPNESKLWKAPLCVSHVLGDKVLPFMRCGQEAVFIWDTPLPIAQGDAGGIHSGSGIQSEDILKGDYRQETGAGIGDVNELPVDIGRGIEGKSALPIIGEGIPSSRTTEVLVVVRQSESIGLKHVLIPAVDGVVVVGSGINDSVSGIKGGIDLRIIKAELENDHSGQGIAVSDPANLIVEDAEVFGDKAGTVILIKQCVKELFSRSRDPFAVDGGILIGRYAPVVYISDKVIQTEKIIEPKSIPDAPEPPVKSVLCHHLPTESGIAPELTCFREGIRRDSGYRDPFPVVIQIKEMLICPDIGAVVRAVERDIADQSDAQRTQIPVQVVKLLLKHRLQRGIIRDAGLMLYPQLIKQLN